MTHSKQVSARGLLILFVLALCVTADRLSKAWALTNLTHGQPQPFIPGFIQFTLTANPGAAFSIGSQNGQIMGVVATVLSLVILAWIVKRTLSTAPLPVVEQIGMGCLLGGALGNLIDRYTRGQVTDFLEFTFIPFPVFNVADALIDVGIGCLFIAMYLYKQEESKAQNSIEIQSQSASSASALGSNDFPSSNCTGTETNAIGSSDINETTVPDSNKQSDGSDRTVVDSNNHSGGSDRTVVDSNKHSGGSDRTVVDSNNHNGGSDSTDINSGTSGTTNQPTKHSD